MGPGTRLLHTMKQKGYTQKERKQDKNKENTKPRNKTRRQENKMAKENMV